MHTPHAQFASPHAIRFGLVATRRRRASSAMQRQILWPARPKRWKRVADPISLELCRRSDTGRLESENFTLIHGMKTSVTKNSGAAKRLTIHLHAKAMITVHGSL